MISHYLQPILLSACLLVILIWSRSTVIERIGYILWIHIAGFIAIYMVIVFLAFFKEGILYLQLQEFDLNKDGLFTGEEVTTGQKLAMKKLTNDTARKYLIYTGLVYSFMITFALYLYDLFRNYFQVKDIK